MAIRSREELTLADLFAHTLGNLIALTGPQDPRAVPTSAQILEAPDNEVCIPPALFRLVQLVLLPEALGANSGAVLYVAAKRFSRSPRAALHPGPEVVVRRDDAGRARGRARRRESAGQAVRSA